MKKIIALILAFVMIFSFSACSGGETEQNSSAPSPDVPQNKNDEDPDLDDEPKEINPDYVDLVETLVSADAVCGVAYVGFLDDPFADAMSGVLEAPSDFLEFYSFAAEIPQERIVETDGYEIYCIVPASIDYSVKVEEVYFPDDPDAWEPVVGEIIYESETGEPIIVKCNESDIFTNVLITITTSDGTEKKITPYMNLMDGSLSGINEDESGLLSLNFSRYDASTEDFYSFDELVDGDWTAYHYTEDENIYVLSLDFFYDDQNGQCVEFWYGLENSDIDEIFTGTVYENYDENENWDGGYTLDMSLTGGFFYEGESRPLVCSYKFQKIGDELNEVFATHYGMESPFFEGYEYQVFYFVKAVG